MKTLAIIAYFKGDFLSRGALGFCAYKKVATPRIWGIPKGLWSSPLSLGSCPTSSPFPPHPRASPSPFLSYWNSDGPATSTDMGQSARFSIRGVGVFDRVLGPFCKATWADIAMIAMDWVAGSDPKVYGKVGARVGSSTLGHLLRLALELTAFFHFEIFSNIFFTSGSISIANQLNMRTRKEKKNSKEG